MKLRTVLIVALASLAAPPLLAATGGTEAAAIQGSSTGACLLAALSAPVEEPLSMATFTSLADCSADCLNGWTVSCSGSICSAQDQICGDETSGFASCDGTTHRCPPPVCDNGEERMVRDGCCDGGTYQKQQWRFEKCVDCQWVTTGWSCSGECSPF